MDGGIEYQPSLAHIYLTLAMVVLLFKRNPSEYTVGFLMFLGSVAVAIHASLYSQEGSIIGTLQSLSHAIQALVNFMGAFAT